ncbi:hypothetical protein N7G274_007084 [Stereocaulon virgatum]|uniref:Uncharacterized protein n=1 Tax=Stereocaulon virgatum TaxID=373712 RepID=A0ABR4A4A5_9LECA
MYAMFIPLTKEKPDDWAHDSWEGDELSDREDSKVLVYRGDFRNDRTLESKDTCAARWVNQKKAYSHVPLRRLGRFSRPKRPANHSIAVGPVSLLLLACSQTV